MSCAAAPVWKAILASGLLAFAWRAVATPCPPPARVDATNLSRLAASEHPNRGFLWQLTKDGRRYFLYGTVHVARLEWDFPGPIIKKHLQEAPALAVELDVTSPGLAAQLRAAGRDRGSATGPEARPELEREVDEQLRAACVDPARLQGFPLPMKIDALLVLSARNEGLYPDFSIDAALVGFARVLGKPVVELESVSEQAAALEGISSLRGKLDSLALGNAARSVSALAGAWATSDSSRLARAEDWCECTLDGPERAGLERALLQRNAILAGRIAKFYEANAGGFAAIGTLHLFGERSVIEYLQRAGYEAHPLWPVSRP